MALLGLAVRTGSTRVDDWFAGFTHGPATYLRFFADQRVLVVIVLATLAVTNHRRQWRLAFATAACPLAAMGFTRVLKPWFGRRLEGALAYPSGHAATTAAAMGMVVLVAGTALWAVLLAVAYSLLAIVGLAVSYHYFTDTVGGVLLGTAIICVAALILRRVPHQT